MPPLPSNPRRLRAIQRCAPDRQITPWLVFSGQGKGESGQVAAPFGPLAEEHFFNIQLGQDASDFPQGEADEAERVGHDIRRR